MDVPILIPDIQDLYGRGTVQVCLKFRDRETNNGHDVNISDQLLLQLDKDWSWILYHVQWRNIKGYRFDALSVLQSQPKVSGHPQKKALPRFPSFNVATMMSTFLWIFFWTCKTRLGRGYGEKGSHCPMLSSEIVWKSYVKYVVSFYVMWISTLLQSHVRAPPVQRWRCTILNKIITAATAVKLHGNWCSLNHVDMNL